VALQFKFSIAAVGVPSVGLYGNLTAAILAYGKDEDDSD
jgi:hypothetical protein